jgi:hypothetical protein
MAQAPDGANARSYLQSRLRLGSSVTLRPQTITSATAAPWRR